ncbi:HdeD family acid-resistance protein [Elizabethkingia anophelis]|uniref:DUF308 domain-containing protein n=1 Tax=Elizabethkingia anophelis TaxID=1117645 RepID=A0A494J8Z0_9FLAO|nr:DUF308 domain-containing protein [Elizabethkingia anophelis]AQX51346.1 hypothetical protein AYC66_11940 [Elizabethkingia anophelis]MCT4196667.1 DUF308 domain-containing protein [Elizabethkingia anophelis]MCT4225389.1 DUF308 domain-containing protein [Elizabethkingia anophelis]MCT4306980.1 DUF308 domain-containing protein [Elizabethkingia anophelis]MDV2472739.1 hypothetical protein [Elizabethkingia anophelis]
MSDSFNTTIKGSIKSKYFALVTAVISIITGILLFAYPIDNKLNTIQICAGAFIIFGLLRLVFSFQNRRIINGWGWHLIYGMLILDMGIYLLIYKGGSAFILMSFIALFRAFTFLGTSIDLKRHEHYGWKSIAIWSTLAILFAIMSFSPSLFGQGSTIILLSITFIATGIASIFLFREFSKINQYHRTIRKMMRSLEDEI